MQSSFLDSTLDPFRQRVRLEVIGSALSLYVNGTLQLTANDSQFAAGRAGLATFFASAVFDDVVVNP